MVVDFAHETQWIVLDVHVSRTKHRHLLYRAKCPMCLNQFVRTKKDLKRTAGCKACTQFKKHGLCRTRMYEQWKNMRRRCINLHPDYGGRGITVCPEWEDFEVFLTDMGECPDGYQIDRIDNNGNYEPGNCRWVSRTTNCRNRRNTLMLTVNGVTKPLAVWAEETGLAHSVIYSRLRRGCVMGQILKPVPENLRRSRAGF